jgi:hypothetical protein
VCGVGHIVASCTASLRGTVSIASVPVFIMQFICCARTAAHQAERPPAHARTVTTAAAQEDQAAQQEAADVPGAAATAPSAPSDAPSAEEVEAASADEERSLEVCMCACACVAARTGTSGGSVGVGGCGASAACARVRCRDRACKQSGHFAVHHYSSSRYHFLQSQCVGRCTRSELQRVYGTGYHYKQIV